MTGLFVLLSGFIINPYFQSDYTITAKEKAVIVSMVKMSEVEKKCSITGPVGLKEGSIVLGLICSENNDTYKARIGIDFKNKLWMVKRFYPSQWK